ncbi:MAG: sugar phosphate isomerase/epimerase [Clostridiales bacterium]|nr:sugar phosphate isomerase/epimerase [Clostridiales bacterium]
MWKRKLCLATSGQFARPVEEQIRLFAATGFEGFFTGWTPDEDIAHYAAIARAENMLYQSIHAPFTRMAEMWQDGERGDGALAELIDCLRVCADNAVPVMVAHAFIGFKDHAPTEIGVERFVRLARAAERLGVRLAVENTEGEEYLAAVMDACRDIPAVGFCWDTGHEMCYNHSRDMTALYGDRLIATHLNDNLGIRDFSGEITYIDDLHLLPFDGIADWDGIARRLNRCGFSGPLTFELNTLSKPNRHENDGYTALPLEQYLALAYGRACRVATLVERRAADVR